MTTPHRSLEQRRAALERANTIRVRRAILKQELKAGAVSLEAVICRDVEGIRQASGRLDELELRDLASMKVYDAVIHAPKFGRVKANRALNRAMVSPSKTLGGMTSRQRVELLEVLGFARREEAVPDNPANDQQRPGNGRGGYA